MPAPSRDIGFQFGRTDTPTDELGAAVRVLAGLCVRAGGTTEDLREVLGAIGYFGEYSAVEVPEPEPPEPEPVEVEPVAKPPREPSGAFARQGLCRNGEHPMVDVRPDKHGHKRCPKCRERAEKTRSQRRKTGQLVKKAVQRVREA